MKRGVKVLLIVLIFLVIIIGILLSKYSVAKERVKQSYVDKYEQCLRIQEERGVDYSGNSEFDAKINLCLDEGGCYMSCGSPGSRDNPHYTFLEFIKPFKGGRLVAAVCVPECRYPLEHFE